MKDYILNDNVKFISASQFQNETSIDYNILTSYKVYPRKLKLNYLSDNFYIYCYIDPFESFIDPDEGNKKVLKVDLDEINYYFGYRPFYIGKAVSRTGYRLYQHLNSYINNRYDPNMEKKRKFKEIEEKMEEVGYTWDQYKEDCIMILEVFDNEHDLLQREMELINSLGVVHRDRGFLTNKITTYKQHKFSDRNEI